MSALDFALRAAKQKLEAATSRHVIYRRASDGSEHAIRATVSSPNKKNRETVHGVSIVVDRRDWIVFSWTLPFDPERSDRIVDTSCDLRSQTEYEVVAESDEKCFRSICHFQNTLRIHTVKR